MRLEFKLRDEDTREYHQRALEIDYYRFWNIIMVCLLEYNHGYCSHVCVCNQGLPDYLPTRVAC